MSYENGPCEHLSPRDAVNLAKAMASSLEDSLADVDVSMSACAKRAGWPSYCAAVRGPPREARQVERSTGVCSNPARNYPWAEKVRFNTEAPRDRLQLARRLYGACHDKHRSERG